MMEMDFPLPLSGQKFIFLSRGGCINVSRGISVLVAGDRFFSYPDCRDETIKGCKML